MLTYVMILQRRPIIVLVCQLILCVDEEVVCQSPMLIVMHNCSHVDSQLEHRVNIAFCVELSTLDNHMQALKYVGSMRAVMVGVVSTVSLLDLT